MRDIAWKAQVRLCAVTVASGKKLRSSWLRLSARWAAFLSSGERSRHRKVKEDSLFLPLPRAGSGARKAGELPSLERRPN